jgi:hypothetical protein
MIDKLQLPCIQANIHTTTLIVLPFCYYVYHAMKFDSNKTVNVRF